MIQHYFIIWYVIGVVFCFGMSVRDVLNGERYDLAAILLQPVLALLGPVLPLLLLINYYAEKMD